MGLIKKVVRWLSGLFAPPRRKVQFVEGDELPAELPPRDLVIAREGDLLWAAGFQCPCGCGRRLELMLLPNVKPRWDLHVDRRGRPTLTPSVWVNDGCRAHFWMREGRVEWC